MARLLSWLVGIWGFVAFSPLWRFTGLDKRLWRWVVERRNLFGVGREGMGPKKAFGVLGGGKEHKSLRLQLLLIPVLLTASHDGRWDKKVLGFLVIADEQDG
jgi:hypothetical protein